MVFVPAAGEVGFLQRRVGGRPVRPGYRRRIDNACRSRFGKRLGLRCRQRSKSCHGPFGAACICGRLRRLLIGARIDDWISAWVATTRPSS